MSKRNFLLGLLLCVLLQSVALGNIIYQRASVLMNGQEVLLETGFVDPRDLFRGHYVRLNLLIGSEISETNIAPDLKRKDEVYLELKKTDSVFWKGGRIVKSRPENATVPIIKGEWRGLKYKEGRQLITFPFDRYFAPKLQAKALEKLQRDQKLGVILALDGKGNGVIKGIVVEGETIYDEPLW